MNDELKPCPFCGSKAEIKRYDCSLTYVKCSNNKCLVEPCTVFCRSREQAIRIWNTRLNES